MQFCTSQRRLTTESIRAFKLGGLYFLETSTQVGGAHSADFAKFGTGVDLWAEWAMLEAATSQEESDSFAASRTKYVGFLVC